MTARWAKQNKPFGLYMIWKTNVPWVNDANRFVVFISDSSPLPCWDTACLCRPYCNGKACWSGGRRHIPMAMMKVGNVGSTTPVWLLTSLPYYCFVTVIQLSTSELWSKLGQSEVRWCNTLYEATTSNLRMCVYVRDCARACVHVQYVCVQWEWRRETQMVYLIALAWSIPLSHGNQSFLNEVFSCKDEFLSFDK